MKKMLPKYWKIIKTAFKSWYAKDPFRESAIIAYYAIFSLPGLLVVIITLAGYFFGKSEVSGYLNQQIAAAMSVETAKQIQVIIAKAYDAKQSTIATIIGIGTIILGATGVFIQFQKSLNFIWEVKPDTDASGIWEFIKARLFSLGLIITIAFLLLISLVISTMLSALSEYIKNHWPDYIMFLFGTLNFIFSFAIISVLFALMFKFMPDAKVRWNTVWTGAVLTAFLFVLGKSALGVYFGQANPGSGYGAAGFIILILLWTSYSSMIVFFGAEFTKAYSDILYGKPEPSSFAKKDELADCVNKVKEEDAKKKEVEKNKKKRQVNKDNTGKKQDNDIK